MSPENAAGRRSPQLTLGWVALGVLIVTVAVVFVNEHIAFGFLALGGILILVCLGMEMRTRKAVESHGTAFEEGGTFGGRRSPQTHTHM